jgi:hypothetical protein
VLTYEPIGEREEKVSPPDASASTSTIDPATHP